MTKFSHITSVLSASSRRVLTTIAIALTLAACDSGSTTGDPGSSPTDQQALGESIAESITTSPVDVMSGYVQRNTDPARAAAPQTDLLENGGFENGVAGWTSCAPGRMTASNDAYDANHALLVSGGNCIYQSVQVEPGQDLVLSCYIRGVDSIDWAGMGLGFSDSSWNTIFETPATIVSGTDYARYDVSATVPAGASYVSMWFYSETDALIDKCSLVPATLVVDPPPVVSTDNLLENPEFDDVTNGTADNWQTFCEGGSSVVDENGNSALQVFDGACVSQALSASDIALMQGEVYELACDVDFNSNRAAYEHYATISLTLDGEEIHKVIPRNTASRVSLTVLAPDTASNGYVTVYSINEPGALKVFNCALAPFEGTSGEGFGNPENNLLANGGFDAVETSTGLPSGWNQNCGGGNDGGTYTSIDSPLSDAAFELDIGNDPVLPCTWTILSPEAIAELKHNSFVLSCDAWNYAPQNTTGNAWLDLRYSDAQYDFNEQRMHFAASAYYQPFSISGQFNDLTYARLQIYGTQLRIDNCHLETTGDNSNRSSINIRANVDGADGYAVDGPFTFDVTLTNDGNQPLNDIRFSSEEITCDGVIGSRAAGWSETYECTSQVVLDESNSELRINLNASATSTDGQVVEDSDSVDHFYTTSTFGTVSSSIKAKTKTVLPGDDAIVEVALYVVGKGGSLDATSSNFSSCAKTYNPPLTDGQYDIYQCIIPNVQQDTTVTLTVDGFERDETIFVYEE